MMHNPRGLKMAVKAVAVIAAFSDFEIINESNDL